MSAYRMTPSEQMVGRRLPPPPKHIDTVMANFVSNSDAAQFCGKMTPIGRWLKPAHLKARRSGWIETGISFGRGMEIWFPTERGKPEALAAAARVKEIETARMQWFRECYAAFAAKAA